MLTWVLAIIRKEGGSNGIQHECLFSFLYVCIITTWKIYYLWHVIHNLFKAKHIQSKGVLILLFFIHKIEKCSTNMYILHKSKKRYIEFTWNDLSYLFIFVLTFVNWYLKICEVEHYSQISFKGWKYNQDHHLNRIIIS